MAPQDDVEVFIQEDVGGVAIETAIGAFNELYRWGWTHCQHQYMDLINTY
jgi:hypothetical protein